jgi:RNA polymerase sigma-54 factor
MKFFFTPGYQNERGESFSNKSLKQAIEDVVAAEDRRKPLSDEDIVAKFAQQGITLARRTVAKYRAELKILPSHLRRRS